MITPCDHVHHMLVEESKTGPTPASDKLLPTVVHVYACFMSSRDVLN